MIATIIQTLLRGLLVVTIALGAVVTPVWAEPSGLETLHSEHRLPSKLATKIAAAAIDNCAQQGAHVSATVVDQHGLPIVQLQGDGAAPHTWNLSFQKAYTAAALGPLQGVNTTSAVAEKLRASLRGVGEMALPTSSVAYITPIAGGMVIETDHDILGGIGVSGAKSGSQDELCAAKGLQSIQAAVPLKSS